MSEPGEVRTPYLVLRKTEYSETSLVLAGITPESGRLHFLARGARRLGRRRFPVVDLFRVLEVVYRPGRGELQTWRSVALHTDYSGLGHRYDAYCTAVWLARFALGNVMPNVPHPRFFRAMLCALQRLLDDTAPRSARLAAARLGPALVFLDENGSLPVASDHSVAARTRTLLGMAVGTEPVPALTPQNWERLWGWLVLLLRQGECRLPATEPTASAAAGRAARNDPDPG